MIHCWVNEHTVYTNICQEQSFFMGTGFKSFNRKAQNMDIIWMHWHHSNRAVICVGNIERKKKIAFQYNYSKEVSVGFYTLQIKRIRQKHKYKFPWNHYGLHWLFNTVLISITYWIRIPPVSELYSLSLASACIQSQNMNNLGDASGWGCISWYPPTGANYPPWVSSFVDFTEKRWRGEFPYFAQVCSSRIWLLKVTNKDRRRTETHCMSVPDTDHLVSSIFQVFWLKSI